MKNYVCKKDYYIGNDLFAKTGDNISLLPDNVTVVNTTRPNSTKAPYIVRNNEYFFPVTNQDNYTDFTSPKELAVDNVNHPKHYTQHPSGIECIEITRHHDFCIGNAIKYLWRAGLKVEQGMEEKQKEIEDLSKAIWYIKDKIKQLENG